MVQLKYPDDAKEKRAYWLMPGNLLAARRKLRRDNSNLWRYSFKGGDLGGAPDRAVSFSRMIDRKAGDGFRFLVLGDTGEGDRSQYSTLPLIRALAPDFMIINGDVAYPAGRRQDFEEGFFKPYRNLDIPIWAVPGNHEYYSRSHGEEFYQLFCTGLFRSKWSEYGLRFEQQPGTYWELSEGEIPLVVIGVDTGKSANLDGHGWLNSEDRRQHEWLRWRLGQAEAQHKAVILLFHIPALLRGIHQKQTHLTRLHQLIGESSAVRLVLCGHEHNSQLYSPDTFRKYLLAHHKAADHDAARDWPHYWVSGGGGAFLGSTDFPPGAYPAKEVYPTREQWRRYTKWAKRMVGKVNWIASSPLGRVVSMFNDAPLSDADAGKYLSFVLVEVHSGSIDVTPLFMDELAELYPSHWPQETVVRVDASQRLLDEAKVEAIKRHRVRL
ncbi:MAG: metallophosphoesterase [Gammaproteobacteria bacterium]|nr:metallophosphoesterase [Gammaproteobacteria bacterium]